MENHLGIACETSRALRASGLPPSVEKSELQAMLQPADRLISIQLPCNEKGLCLGYALFEFDTANSASKALTKLNGSLIPGHLTSLLLKVAKKGAEPVHVDAYQLCIGNLANSVTNGALYDTVSVQSMGTLGARVPCDPETGLSFGYGFVRYASDRDAVLATRSLPGTELAGRQIMVRETYQQQSERHDGAHVLLDLTLTRILVGALHHNINEVWLRRAFSAFGKILEVELVHKHGFGFITFQEHDAALAALSLMQNRDICGQKVYLRWATHGRHQSIIRDHGDAESDDWEVAMTPRPMFAASRRTLPSQSPCYDLMKSIAEGRHMPPLKKFKAVPSTNLAMPAFGPGDLA